MCLLLLLLRRLHRMNARLLLRLEIRIRRRRGRRGSCSTGSRRGLVRASPSNLRRSLHRRCGLRRSLDGRRATAHVDRMRRCVRRCGCSSRRRRCCRRCRCCIRSRHFLFAERHESVALLRAIRSQIQGLSHHLAFAHFLQISLVCGNKTKQQTANRRERRDQTDTASSNQAHA